MFCWHQWRYFYQYDPAEQLRFAGVWGYRMKDAKYANCRECAKCGKKQQLDVDGWCNV